jgi:hypothetical protein
MMTVIAFEDLKPPLTRIQQPDSRHFSYRFEGWANRFVRANAAAYGDLP